MLHPLLQSAFYAFEQAGLRWCLLRVPSNPAAPTGDVDLLVDRADIKSMRRALEALGFVQLSNYREGNMLFLRYHRSTDCWIVLDVVAELSFGRDQVLRTHAEAGCLARRQHNGALVVLAPDDAFWALLLHCLLDKGGVEPRYVARLQEMAAGARMDGQLAQVVQQSCPVGWNAERIVECVRRGDWSALGQFAPDLAAMSRQQDPRGVWRMFVTHGVSLMAMLLTMLRRRGLSVALLGPDGAGKSTLAAGIEKSFYFPVRSVYMGQTTRGPLRYLGVPGSVLVRHLLVLWSRYLAAQYHQLRGRLVIFDRHSYEFLPHLNKPLTRVRRVYFWLLSHALPGPDLVLVLDAPSDVMYKRKGERTVADLEAERRLLLTLRQRIPQLLVVDTTSDKDAIRADVVEHIWARYADRWRKF